RAPKCLFAGSRAHLRSHLKGVHKYLECPVDCEIEFVGPNKRSIREHLKNSHGGQTMCQVAKCRFAGLKDDMNGHLISVHKWLECTVPDCKVVKAHKKTLSEHQRLAHAEKEKCPLEGCNWVGTKRQLSQYHRYQHSGARKCPVPGCSLIRNPRSLSIHVRGTHKMTDITLAMAMACEVVEQASNVEGSEVASPDGSDNEDVEDVDDDD
ncbi:hypothetical protein QBC45DRAFT_298391, partial [Copromyces sp. CBS 386.78]